MYKIKCIARLSYTHTHQTYILYSTKQINTDNRESVYTKTAAVLLDKRTNKTKMFLTSGQTKKMYKIYTYNFRT